MRVSCLRKAFAGKHKWEILILENTTMIETLQQRILFELEDGRFVKLLQTEEGLEIIIPATMKWFSMKQIRWNLIVIMLLGILFLFGPLVLFWITVKVENIPLWYCLCMIPLFFPLIIVYASFIMDLFSKKILRFTKTHFIIKKRFVFIPIWKRVPLAQVGKSSCEMVDDLYWDWPEDVVRIPWGKNEAFDIYHIKTFENQEKLADAINSFVSSLP